MDYRTLVSPIAAVLLALIAFWIARRGDLTVQRSATARLSAFAQAERRDLTERVGDTVMERLGLRLEAWKRHLRWAQLGGHYLTSSGQPRSVGSVLGQSIVFGALGLLYIVLFQAYSPIYLAIIGLAAYYPYLTLSGRADSVREAVKRGLPEAAALIAAEMNAGNSIALATERAGELPGPIGVLLREASARARAEGALLFSQAGSEGALRRHFAELDFGPLDAFAARMDAVAEHGVEGPQRMNELARDLALEYRVAVARAAETLDNKLLMPMTVFFFVPFLASIFIPLMLSMFSSF